MKRFEQVLVCFLTLIIVVVFVGGCTEEYRRAQEQNRLQGSGATENSGSSRSENGQPDKSAGAIALCGSGIEPANAPEGIWRNPDWLFCRDGKWRPVEPSLFGVVDGLPDELVRSCNISRACNPLAKEQEARMMRLKGYGNAIVPIVAAEVIKAYMETTL